MHNFIWKILQFFGKFCELGFEYYNSRKIFLNSREFNYLFIYTGILPVLPNINFLKKEKLLWN